MAYDSDFNSDEDGFYSDEDLPIISTETNKLLTAAQKDTAGLPSIGYSDNLHAPGPAPGSVLMSSKPISTGNLHSLERSKPSGSSTNDDMPFEILKTVIKEIRTVTLPSPVSAAERKALFFLCRLIGTFQGSLAIRYSEIHATYVQLYGEALDFKPHVADMMSLLFRDSQAKSIRPKTAPSKFLDFLKMIPLFAVFSPSSHVQSIWIIRYAEPVVKKWALQQTSINSFICAFAAKEIKVKVATVLELVEHLFCKWGDKSTVAAVNALAKKAISSSWTAAEFSRARFKFLESSSTLPNAGLPDPSTIIIIPTLSSENRIGPCGCFVCCEKHKEDMQIKTQALGKPEEVLGPKKPTVDSSGETDSSYKKEWCQSLPSSILGQTIEFGTSSAGLWSNWSKSLLVAEKVYLCFNRNHFGLGNLRNA